MSVWEAVVGQTVVEAMRAAVADAAAIRHGIEGAGSIMTHAWLFTGPPGSGRSVLAKAFAAGLQCEDGGCAACSDCRSVLSGQHPDVLLVATEGLSISVRRVREELVPTASRRPSRGRWQVVVVEDADRFTEDAADGVLLAIEEPARRTVWILCAPTAEDVPPTIRSRCRVVTLRTPPPQAVTAHLVAAGVDPAMAAHAARASMGHIGRARALAQDEQVRRHRRDILAVPFALAGLGECLDAAAALVAAAEADAEATCDQMDARETESLKSALGFAGGVRRDRSADARLKDLERDQKARRTRTKRDFLDRALVDLLSLYRDVLHVQLVTGADLVNADVGRDLDRLARQGTAESTMRKIDAVLGAREALDANAAPLLAMEHMVLSLRIG